MKAKSLLAFLSLFALVGCASTPEVPVKDPEPFFERTEINSRTALGFRGSDSSFVTYLMIGPFGYLSADGVPVKGSVDELFYENTITWTGAAGTALPDATIVKTTVNGSTFRGWAYYDEDNDHVWPDYYSTVPSKSGVALKAIFDGTDAGGNTGGGGGGGSGGGGGGGTVTTGFGIIKGDGTVHLGVAKGKNFEGYDEYFVEGVTFTTGETFSLYDPSTLGKWAVNINPYSFSPDPEHGTSDPERVASYVIKNTTDYTVVQDFTADLYIQILYQQDRLYIQLA